MKFAFASAAALAAFALPFTLAAPAAHAQAEAQAPLTRAQIRAAVAELAELMQQSYVFPDVARQYAAHLRTRAATGAYDTLTDPTQLASTLQTELRALHQDAHLRITLATPGGPPVHGRGPQRAGAAAVLSDAWFADGVAYLRINGLPGDDANVQQMGAALNRYADARALILDLRTCPGGGLAEMDVLFSRLYAAPTHVMIMDTRTGANPQMEDAFSNTPTLRRVAGPEGITRFEHWAQPTAPVNALADAQVFVLTGRTGSACEHLSQALRETGRATLVGSNTGGAGHYGGDRVFSDGRFQIFLPVGNSYAPGAQSWETVGVAPHRQVAPEEALNDVLRELGVPLSAAANIAAAPDPTVERVVVGVPPGQPRYGLAMQQPRGGESFVTIEEVVPGLVAAQAGLRAGDRILSLNGRAISEIPAAEFGAAMRASPMTMVIERGGQQQTIQMSLGG